MSARSDDGEEVCEVGATLQLFGKATTVAYSWFVSSASGKRDAHSGRFAPGRNRHRRGVAMQSVFQCTTITPVQVAVQELATNENEIAYKPGFHSLTTRSTPKSGLTSNVPRQDDDVSWHRQIRSLHHFSSSKQPELL